MVSLWLTFMTFSLFWCFLAVGFYGIMRYGGGVISDCFWTMDDVRVELNSPHCKLRAQSQPSEHLSLIES